MTDLEAMRLALEALERIRSRANRFMEGFDVTGFSLAYYDEQVASPAIAALKAQIEAAEEAALAE